MGEARGGRRTRIYGNPLSSACEKTRTRVRFCGREGSEKNPFCCAVERQCVPPMPVRGFKAGDEK
jgi:hypothetical protein